MLNIVLVEPEIPQNTGNVARTCAATGSRPHLVRPFGFEITDKHLKRAGLDYWHLVEIFYYDSFQEVLDKFSSSHNFWFFSTKAAKIYSDARYRDGDFRVFGKEAKGVDEKLLAAHYENCVRLPMTDESRSLNLGNSVCAGVYEALRQLSFPGLKCAGEIPQK